MSDPIWEELTRVPDLHLIIDGASYRKYKITFEGGSPIVYIDKRDAPWWLGYFDGIQLMKTKQKEKRL